MKISFLFVMLMAVIALFVPTSADPKVNVNAVRKGGSAIRKGLGVAGAAGTAHEIYDRIRNRKNNG